MYINQIDELIDKLIDEFYLTSIADNKNLDKILGEPDYVKFQKEINEMMINFSKRINITEIRTLVKSIDAAYQIEQTIKRYIAYYIFLLIGFHYTDREELFINNIVEFTKNQYNYNFKIEKFFNSESNALLLKYKTIMQYILIKLGTDQTKVDRIRNRKEYKETIAFLNSLPSMEYITSKFMIQNTNNIQAHNIIKTLIIVLMYGANDKRDFFKLLELSEITEGEYTFIDIVVPTKKTVDFTLIENILSKSPHGKTNAYNFWRFFTDREDEISLPPLSHDEKILKLINSGIVVPIVDDFILYHKDVEKYDKVTDPNKTKKKEDTKIKYIINKIDNIKEYYSEQIVVDEKIRSEIKKLFYVPLLNRKAVLVNMKEDINIINKFINIGKQNVENIDYLKDLEQYNTYPYVNFSEFEKSGFSLTLSKTINTIRSVSLAKSGDFRQTISYNIIQTRTGSKDMTINIVGFAVPSTITPLPCIKIKNVFDVKTLDPNNKNGYQLILKYLRDTFMNLNQHNKTIAWLFDEDTDAIEQSEYEQLSKFSMVDRTKSIASNLYDKIYEELQTIMINIFNEGKDTITIQDGYDIIDQLERNLLPISHDRKLYPDIEYALFNSIQTLIPEYDKNDDIVYNFESLFGSENKKTETLKNLKGIEKPPIPVYRVNLSAINEYGNIDVKEKVSGICQHTITFDTISAIGKKDYVKMSEELHRFIQKYVTLNMYDDHVCKSCGSNLDIKKYIEDGEYDDDSRTFVSYATPININLTDVVGYEKYRESIKNIDKIIEKVATVSNILHLTKGSVNVKSKRKLIVKSTIDLILNNYKRLKKISKERKIASAKSYGINENLSNLFVFELTDEIFKFSSKDIDKLKPLKQNNAICYSIFMTILEINNTHVLFMKNDKKKMCNFNNFEKIIDALFGNLRIIINNRGEIAPIINYKILCYMIYVISCAVVSYTKLWYYDGENSKKKDY